jgi:hypothetical protein
MRFAKCWTWKLNWPPSYLTETTPTTEPGSGHFLKNNRFQSLKTIDTFHGPLHLSTRSGTLIDFIYVNFERTANEWRTANHSPSDSQKVGNKFRRENVKATMFLFGPDPATCVRSGPVWVNDETTGCAAAAAAASAGADLFSLWLHLESPGIKIKWENKNGRKLC